MPLFSSTQPSLRARILPRFPARVLAGNGMIITKANGSYTFAATGDVATLGHLPDIGTDRIIGRDTTGSGSPEEIAVSGGLGFTGAGSLELTANQRRRAFTALFPTVAVNTRQEIVIPISCTITRVTLLANVSGSAVVDILKTTFSGYDGSLASICASAKPTLSSVIKSQDSTLTGWTTTVTAGDILRFNIDSFTTVARLSLTLEATSL